MELKDRFNQLCFPFTQNQNLIDSLWQEIETKYAEKSRHYHNLEHLQNMFSELESVKDKVSNFNRISFSVFYHDVIYDASSKSNEEKSAEYAKIRLQKLDMNQELIVAIANQIIATKAHQKSDDQDTNYLLDSDLSILGKDIETYLEYTKKIRKEYSIYPDLLYKPRRKKVLQHFLALENIFKTDYFQKKYEVQAKENIELEISLL